MKKLLIASLFSLLFAFNVYSQNTNVSATVTDAGGQAWNNGTYIFNFYPSPTWNGTYKQSGSTFNPVPITGSLSATGTFTSVPVPDNALITPSGTKWTVTVCAQTQFICFTSNPITITGVSQTITSSLIPPAILVNCGPGVNAYADSEVSCGVGGQYYNLTSQTNRVCQAVTGNTCTTWASSGGGITSVASLPATCTPGGTNNTVQITGSIVVNGVTYGAGTVFYCDSTNHYSPVSQGSGASPIVGWYLGPNCPVANTGQCFFTTANVLVDNTCSWSGTTVTCSDGPFTSTNATNGMQIMGHDSGAAGVTGGCSPFSNAINSTGQITTTHTTITGFISSTQVSIANTVANNSTTTSGCVVWGSTDDSGTTALETAIATSVSCPRITLQAGNYFWTAPHFFANPSSCFSLPGQAPFGNGSGNLGNMMLAYGMELEGRGVGATQVFLPLDFPESGSCNHAFYDAGNLQACFGVAPLGFWHDFAMVSVPSGASGMPANVALISLGVGTIANFTAANIGYQVTGTSCISQSVQAQLTFVNLSSCGKIGITNQASTGGSSGMYPGPTGFRVSVDSEVTADVAIVSGGVWRCDMCWFGVGQVSGTQFTANIGIFNHGGTMYLHNSSVALPANGQIPNFPTMYDADTSNSVLYADNSTLGYNKAAFGTTNGAQVGINCSAACTNYLLNDLIQGAARNSTTSTAYQDVAGSILYDLGGNKWLCGVFSGGVCNVPNIAGTVIASGSGSNGGQVTTAKTNFGTNLGAQTILAGTAFGSAPWYANNLEVKVTLRQTTLGTTCGVGSNTVNGTLSWTTNGLSQTATISTLTVSANGTVGTSAFQIIPIRPDANTSVTFTTSSTLASAGCTIVPQYQVDAVI